MDHMAHAEQIAALHGSLLQRIEEYKDTVEKARQISSILNRPNHDCVLTEDVHEAWVRMHTVHAAYREALLQLSDFGHEVV